MSILNLTQHAATPEQIDAGVVEPSPKIKREISHLLNFETLDSVSERGERAVVLAMIVKEAGVSRAMIGGAPFFMSTLESALVAHGIKPVYAFSVRESVEQALPDGSVRKVNIFKHIGFVE